MTSQCTSQGRCRNCGQQHHKLLCEKVIGHNEASKLLKPSAPSYVPLQEKEDTGWLKIESLFSYDFNEPRSYSYVNDSS